MDQLYDTEPGQRRVPLRATPEGYLLVQIAGGGGGGGSSVTNLTTTVSPTNVVVASDTGTDATIPLADVTNAGAMPPAAVTQLAGLGTASEADVGDFAAADHTHALLMTTNERTKLGALPAAADLTTSLDGKMANTLPAMQTAFNAGTAPEKAAFQASVSGYQLLYPSGNAAIDTATLVSAFSTANARIQVRGSWTVSQPVLIEDGVVVDAWTATFNQSFAGNLFRNTQALTASGRNKNIKWYGGTINRGTNSGTGLDLHTTLFVGVDGLVFWPEKITSSAGKYSVYLCDTTKFDVGNIDFASASDGVHMLHKCVGGTVHDITGTTGDDSVALTVYDYNVYNIATRFGTSENISIRNIRTTTTKNGVKILGGKNSTTSIPGVASGISVSSVSVSAGEAALAIFGDSADAWTTGGAIGYVEADSISNTGGGHAVSISGDGLSLQTLELSNIYAPPTAYKFPILLAGSCTVNKIRLGDSKLSTQAGTAAISCAAITGWPTVGKLVVDGVNLAVLTKSAGLLANVSPSTNIKQIILRNYHVSQAAWAVGDLYGTTEVILHGVTTAASANVGGVMNVRSGASVTVSGASGYSPTVSTVANAGTVNAKSFGFSVDISTISKVSGAMATNTNAALSCGAGPVICNGTLWKNLYTSDTY